VFISDYFGLYYACKRLTFLVKFLFPNRLLLFILFCFYGPIHLQRMGICHRDLSLENILVDEYKTSLIIDLGMCLRVLMMMARVEMSRMFQVDHYGA
jgi:serine/threonine protein kinase